MTGIGILTFGFLVALAPSLSAQTAAEHVALGDSAYATFDAAAALRHYEQALALDSTHVDALAKASRTSVDLGEPETDKERQAGLFRSAERYARQAVAHDSSSAENWFHLARALGRAALSVGVRERVKYAVEVRSCALRALAIDPNHPGALHVIGMWNAEVKRLNGFELFFARNFLGGGVLGQANWDAAVLNLERAVALDPERLSHHLSLAGIYVNVNQRDKAREQYRFVIDATKRTDFNDPLYKRQAEEALRRLR